MSDELLPASARLTASGRRALAGARAALSGLSAPVRGALYMTAASFGFAVMNVLVREASHELEPTQVAFFRNFFAMLFMLPWLMRMGLRHSLPTANLKLHLLRAAIGLCGMLAWFYSVALLPLAQAVALNFTVPLFATIGAALVLGEVVRARRWTATLIGFLGVLIILRPWGAELSLTTALPVLAAVFMACSILVVKTLSGRDPPGAIVLWANLLLTPLSLVPALFVWRWPSPEIWLLLVGVGAVAVVSHIWLTRSYACADASAVLPFDYTRLPFIAVLAFFLYGEVPDLWTWIGAAVIAASTFYIARREARVARQRAAAESVGPAGRI